MNILLACYGNEEPLRRKSGMVQPRQNTQWGTDAGKEYYNQKDADKAKELLKKAGYNNEKLVLVTNTGLSGNVQCNTGCSGTVKESWNQC